MLKRRVTKAKLSRLIALCASFACLSLGAGARAQGLDDASAPKQTPNFVTDDMLLNADKDASKSTDVAEGETTVDTDAQGTGGLSKAVEEAVTKATKDQKAELAALRSDLAKVLARPVPGGPVLSNAARIQQSSAQSHCAGSLCRRHFCLAPLALSVARQLLPRIISPSFSAASACRPGITWLYRSSVIDTLE